MRTIFSRLSKREKYIVYISITIIVAVFFDRAVLHPLANRIKKLNREILLQEKRLERSLYILSQENLVVSEHKKYTQHVKQSRSDEEEKSELLSEIEKLARKSSVFLRDIKLDLTEKIGPYKQYTVAIEIESKIDYLVDFIYQVENSPRLLRVKNFYLTPKKKKSSVLKAQVTITELLIVSKDDSSL